MWLWGPVGLLLATPLTVCLLVVGKHVPQLSFLDILLGNEPVFEPKDRIYQRLLAGDQEEADELFENYLEHQPLVDATSRCRYSVDIARGGGRIPCPDGSSAFVWMASTTLFRCARNRTVLSWRRYRRA
jgi:hypothetical protein